jgi:hypothetical protein
VSVTEETTVRRQQEAPKLPMAGSPMPSRWLRPSCAAHTTPISRPLFLKVQLPLTMHALHAARREVTEVLHIGNDIL